MVLIVAIMLMLPTLETIGRRSSIINMKGIDKDVSDDDYDADAAAAAADDGDDDHHDAVVMTTC